MSNVDQIAAEVEADRARLARSLDDLTDTVQPHAISQDVTQAATDIGSDLAQKAWSTVRYNPAGGLLLSIGLGLLSAGPRRSMPTAAPQPTAVDPDVALMGFDERMAAADAAMAPPKASRLKAALNNGLDKLPPEARQRVVKARQAVITAQENIERQAHSAARKTSGFVQDQPLTAGALALGFGVLAGTLLRGTRREDELMGQRRDALMAEARNALEDEMLKAQQQAEGVMRKTADRAAQRLSA